MTVTDSSMVMTMISVRAANNAAETAYVMCPLVSIVNPVPLTVVGAPMMANAVMADASGRKRAKTAPKTAVSLCLMTPVVMGIILYVEMVFAPPHWRIAHRVDRTVVHAD